MDMIILPKVRISLRYHQIIPEIITKPGRLLRDLQTFLSQKLPKSNLLVKKSINNPTTLEFSLKKQKIFRPRNHFFKCFILNQSAKFHNILSNLFSILSNFFKSCIIFISDILEVFILTLIIFCNFSIIFYSLAQFYDNFSPTIQQFLRYDISNNFLNVPTSIQ